MEDAEGVRILILPESSVLALKMQLQLQLQLRPWLFRDAVVHSFSTTTTMRRTVKTKFGVATLVELGRTGTGTGVLPNPETSEFVPF